MMSKPYITHNYMQVQLIYFKASGKYYSDAILDLTKQEMEGQYYDIGDRIRKLSEKKSLPGIIGDWLGQEENGFAAVLPMGNEDSHVGWPVLVKNQNNQETFNQNDPFTPGTNTTHVMKVWTFKQHGKWDDKYEMHLDSECISEGVALTHKISDMFCSTRLRRTGYIMFSCPDTLSGCPHLILPTVNPCN